MLITGKHIQSTTLVSHMVVSKSKIEVHAECVAKLSRTHCELFWSMPSQLWTVQLADGVNT